MGRAVVARLSPYLPLAELARELLETLTVPMAAGAHPTPRPPPTVLVAWPLAYMEFGDVAIAWLPVELLSLTAFTASFARRWGARRWLAVGVAGAALLLGTVPVRDELVFGQVGLPMLALVTFALLALEDGKEARAGVFLGLAIALKLFVWPVGVLLVLGG